MLGGTQTFSKIDAKIFHEGMYIPSDLYCMHKDTYVLVMRGSVTLDKITLLKIKHLQASYGSLFMESHDYEDVSMQSEHFVKNLESVEFETNYTDLKNTTNNMLDQISETDTVPQKISQDTTKAIQEKIIKVDTAVIFQLLNNVRSVDEYLYTHSANVAFLNGLMAKWLGMSKTESSALISGGLLHDIGKLKMPDEILNKPGKLTPEEFEVIKKHPVYSYDILLNSGETNPIILTAARNHHEKVNGSGYPDGLVYDDISIPARITAISDVYDAMITRRVYKAPHSPFEILEEFAKGSFINLDMELVKVFLEHMPNELLGKSVLLSNGSIAEIMFIDENNLSHPIVKVGTDVFQIDNNIKCVCMYKN